MTGSTEQDDSPQSAGDARADGSNEAVPAASMTNSVPDGFPTDASETATASADAPHAGAADPYSDASHPDAGAHSPVSADPILDPEGVAPTVASAPVVHEALGPAVPEGSFAPAPVEQVPSAPAVVEQVPPAQPRVVYIETPPPPRERGNRLMGGVIALLGGIVFGATYALAVLILIALTPPPETVRPPAAVTVTGAFVEFTGSAFFWAPILFFTLAFVVLSLIINRGGWWLYVLFSLVVAAVTYFASIGALLLVQRVIFMTNQQAATAFTELMADPRLIIAALVAREVAMWMGLATATRGRRVRARNAERRAQFEQEIANQRAEHERVAVTAP